MSKKISFKEFIKRVITKHGDTFEVIPSDYTGLKKPLDIVCKNHKVGIHLTSATLLTQNNPCKECVRDKKFAIYVLKVSNAMRENLPKLALVGEITGFNCKVVIRCPEHGDSSVLSDSIIFNRTNCKDCRYISSAAKITGRQPVPFKEFKKRFSARYGSKLSLKSDESDFKNMKSFMTVTCSEPSHPEFQKSAHDLLRYQGCKNCKESWGERLTRLALEDLNIEYEREKRFASCRDKKELPFDFWLPKHGTLIEFQGKQHEVSSRRFGGTKALRAVQKRDEIKRVWAFENRINLIYLKDYNRIKEKILKNLPTSSEYDPQKALRRVKAVDQEWIGKKWQKYLNQLVAKHKDRYDFSNPNWKPGQPEITYRCKLHGERKGDLYNLIKGHGCSFCAGSESSLEEVIRRSRERFGEQFDFTNSKFRGMKKNMSFRCKTHGLISLAPENHFTLKKGCRKCSDYSVEFSPEKFLNKAKAKFGNRFDYSGINYKGALYKIRITCLRHELGFDTLAGDHLRHETGACPECVRENKVRVKSKPISVEGKLYPSMKAAAEAYGLQHSTVIRRLKTGWNHDEAFKTSAENLIFVDGAQYPSVRAAATKYGIQRATVAYRLKRGWDIDRAFKTPTKN